MLIGNLAKAICVILLGLKITLAFYGSSISFPKEKKNALEKAPLLSLTNLKKQYNGEFFYAVHALELEHLGDLNGERRPLSQYDPNILERWFMSIDALSSQGNLLPFLVTFYYATSPILKNCCSAFLEYHCDHNPKLKWRWLAHAYCLEKEDSPKAELLAQKLAFYGQQYNLPLWVKDAKARHLLKQGNHNAARPLFQAILDDPNNSLSLEETCFIRSILNS